MSNPELVAGLSESLRGNLRPLLICFSKYWGGLEQTALSDIADLGSCGIGARVLCLEGTAFHQGALRISAAHPAIEILPLDGRPRELFDLGFRKFLLGQVEDGINLIHTHHTSLLGSISPWLWSRPRVALLASRYLMNGHDKQDLLHRMIYGRVDSLIVTSRALKQNVVESHPIRDRRVRVVHPGLDFSRFDPARVMAAPRRAAWGADEQTVVIGTVGRFHPEKGQEIFIKAAAGLLKDRLSEGESGPRLKFVLVGEESGGGEAPVLDELREMVRQFRIGEHVIFEGYDERVAETMLGFDLFVMPARRESLGLVALEAMAMECPVILSDTGSAREVVGSQQEFGLTFRSGDAFDLQRRLRTLVTDRELREAMGGRARQHVVTQYDRSLRLPGLLEIYERCFRVRQAL